MKQQTCKFKSVTMECKSVSGLDEKGYVMHDFAHRTGGKRIGLGCGCRARVCAGVSVASAEVRAEEIGRAVASRWVLMGKDGYVSAFTTKLFPSSDTSISNAATHVTAGVKSVIECFQEGNTVLVWLI